MSPATAAPATSVRASAPSAASSIRIAAISVAGSGPPGGAATRASSCRKSGLPAPSRATGPGAWHRACRPGAAGRRRGRAGCRASWRAPGAALAAASSRGAGSTGRTPEGDQRRRPRRAAQEVEHGLDRGVVGPVQVVEHQRDRPLAGERLEQPAQGAVLVEVLRRSGGIVVELRGDGGQHRAERRVERLDPAAVERGDVVVEGVDDDAVGHVALVLGAAPLEHQQPGGRGALAQRAEQRGLAQPALSEHAEHAARPRPHRLHGLRDRGRAPPRARPVPFGAVTAGGSDLFPAGGFSLYPAPGRNGLIGIHDLSLLVGAASWEDGDEFAHGRGVCCSGFDELRHEPTRSGCARWWATRSPSTAPARCWSTSRGGWSRPTRCRRSDILRRPVPEPRRPTDTDGRGLRPGRRAGGPAHPRPVDPLHRPHHRRRAADACASTATRARRVGFRPADPDLAEHVILDFDGFDAWYDEDEQVFAHPRDPFHAMEILPSSREVRVELDGQAAGAEPARAAAVRGHAPARPRVPAARGRARGAAPEPEADASAPTRATRATARSTGTRTSRGSTRRRCAARRTSPAGSRSSTSASTCSSTASGWSARSRPGPDACARGGAGTWTGVGRLWWLPVLIAEGTLDRVRGGVLRVGVTPAEPWVKLETGKPPAGVEVELVERFARTLDARVQWVEGSETELMGALHGRQLDIVIAGLTRQSVWRREAALTRPYLNTQTVIAAPDERTADRLSDDLGGERIAVEANSPEAAKLEEDTDAVVVGVSDLTTVRPAAVHDYLLDDLGLCARVRSPPRRRGGLPDGRPRPLAHGRVPDRRLRTQAAAGEHPPIGMVELFDWQVWLGWLMIAALLWSAIPAAILGRIKKWLAAELHDKVLQRRRQDEQGELDDRVGGDGGRDRDRLRPLVAGCRGGDHHRAGHHLRRREVHAAVPSTTCSTASRRSTTSRGWIPSSARCASVVAGLDWVEAAAADARARARVQRRRPRGAARRRRT